MLSKKVKATLFIFLILFCIAAVNAESVDDNNGIDPSIKIVDVKSDSYIATLDDEVANNVGNFSALNQTINGNSESAVVDNSNGDITLDKDYTYNSSTDSAFKNGITINRTMTINGAGHIIDGNYTARIFNITNNASLTLKNITLINGNATYGGAIYNNGTGILTLINTTFKNNKAITSGGAIYSEYIENETNTTGNDGESSIVDDETVKASENIIVINSTFTNNTAGKYGGAIYGNKNVTVTSSNFTDNTAGDVGGAIYAAIGNLTAIDSIFTNNYAAKLGGAIYSNHNITVINSTFNKNKAGESGGAIGGNNLVNVTNSTFTNNSATNGGAIYNTNNLTIINSSFTNNNASLGGALYCENSNNIKIVDSKFMKNNATNGGAVYGHKINVANSEFIGNTAKISGAINADDLTVTNSNFTNNTAQTHGGAITSDNITIINSEFTNNTAGSYGGAIYGTQLESINSTFTNNSAASGGAIYIDGNLNIDSSSFENNTAGSYGGAIYSTDSNATITKSEFINNNATTYGGAIYYTNSDPKKLSDVSLTIKDSKFDENHAKYGDDIYTAYNTYVMNNTYTQNSFANIYAKSTIINGTVISVLDNKTYFVPNKGSKFRANATVTVDGASVNGYDITITDGENSYGTTYKGYGVYETNGYITANFTVNTYSATLKNAGSDTNYTIENGTVVTSSEIGLDVEDLEKFYGSNKKLVITLTDASGKPIANQNVTITIHGVEYKRTTDENGTILMSINLDVGNYTATVSYNNITKNATVTIKSTIEAADVVKIYLNGTQYYATFYDVNGTPLANKNVTFNINGKMYTRETDENGTAKLNINLSPGKYIITAINPVNNQTYSNNITVLPAPVTIDVALDDVVTGEPITGNITLRNADGTVANINGDVNVIVNNKTYTVSVVNGTGKLNIENELNEGNYTMDVIFNGTQEYDPANATVNFTVEKSDIIFKVEDLTKYYGNDGKLVINLTDDEGTPLANRTVYITINGVTYNRTTDSNGQVLMSINLAPGEYNVIVCYDRYVRTANVTVLSTIKGSDIVKIYKNGTQYYATFYDVNGTPLANTNVTFNIHGVFYTRETDENGTAKLSINLNPGEYIITAYNPVNNQSFSNNITVLSAVSGENVVKYFKNETQYYATFLDANGNPLANTNVTFNINGVFYTRETNENGTARLNINLNPGEYIITAINPVNNQSYSNVINVLDVIESEDIEMTTESRLPFKATILGDHGEPLANAKVVFNINGVFYEKTTDANGVATLNINLLAGKYIITTMFNGLSQSNTIIINNI